MIVTYKTEDNEQKNDFISKFVEAKIIKFFRDREEAVRAALKESGLDINDPGVLPDISIVYTQGEPGENIYYRHGQEDEKKIITLDAIPPAFQLPRLNSYLKKIKAMIKSNEFRKGNLVLVKGKIIEIFSMAPSTDGITYGFNLFEGGMPEFYDYNADPIPLTSEILERCGFAYTASFGECRFSKDDLQMDENFNPLVQEKDEYLYYGKRLQYLHQLQNLYFALTAEELKINL